MTTSASELTVEQWLQSVWAALRRIEDNLSLPPAPLELPAPQITVSPPDLADVVTAVTSLKPGPTADEIARAIADVIAPPAASPDGAEALGQVARALEQLDFRLKGMGTQAYGGGSVTIQPNQTVGINNWDQMPPVNLNGATVNVGASVEIANDSGNPIPVSGAVTVSNLPATQPVSGTVTATQPTATSATVTSVNGATTSQTLLAANSGRLMACIYNESTDVCYVKLGAAASTSSYTVQLAAGDYFEIPTRYTGAITAVWASATGKALVTEL